MTMDSVNLHVERLSEVPGAIAKVRQMTGEEPVVCVHIYGSSFEAVRDFFQRGKFRTMPVPPGVGSFGGEIIIDDFHKPSPPESSELTEAREMLSKWLGHKATGYVLEQRRHWQRRVDLLSAAQDGEAPPPDDTHEG